MCCLLIPGIGGSKAGEARNASHSASSELIVERFVSVIVSVRSGAKSVCAKKLRREKSRFLRRSRYRCLVRQCISCEPITSQGTRQRQRPFGLSCFSCFGAEGRDCSRCSGGRAGRSWCH